MSVAAHLFPEDDMAVARWRQLSLLTAVFSLLVAGAVLSGARTAQASGEVHGLWRGQDGSLWCGSSCSYHLNQQCCAFTPLQPDTDF